MTLLTCLIVFSLALGGAASAGDRIADTNQGQKHSKHQRGRDKDRDTTRVTLDVRFSTREVQVIKGYYARHRSLPPGLQNKLQRGGQLPPGWRKKLEPFPVVVERELVVLPSGYRRGVIDGHAIIYRPDNQVIVDVAVLF